MTQRQAYADAFRRSRAEAHRIADGLSDDAFNWKPAPDAWSVGECLAHLNVLAERYVPVLEAALSAEDAPLGEGPFRYGWASRRFIDAMRPGAPPTRTAAAMKPPAAASDRSHLDPARTRADFDVWTKRYVGLIDDAEGIDLARIKVRSPFLWILRLPVGAFLDALGQHALRHVAQAERVTQHPAFPG